MYCEDERCFLLMSAKWILRFNHITRRLFGICNSNSPKIGLRVSPDVTQTFQEPCLENFETARWKIAVKSLEISKNIQNMYIGIPLINQVYFKLIIIIMKLKKKISNPCDTNLDDMHITQVGSFKVW